MAWLGMAMTWLLAREAPMEMRLHSILASHSPGVASRTVSSTCSAVQCSAANLGHGLAPWRHRSPCKGPAHESRMCELTREVSLALVVHQGGEDFGTT